MQHRGLKSGDLIAGGFFLLLGLGAIVGAVQLQIGTPSEPQPGFFPFLGGVGLVVLSSLLLVQDWRGQSSGGEPFVEVRRPLLATVGFVAFVVMLDPLGYVLATAALSVVLLLVLGVRLGLRSLLPAVLLSIGSYLLFDRMLDVPLPEGILGALFGH
ncbi:tripartite tricarboxylate transporter TctB family protein [Microvirga subterranea]|uniref:Putative tricarboxylic transport membrane protein n=1 Tax=Microvirga subterranea TaxID=186651 RepID=A0A370HGM9_9HYPH|nr:tripartite tricarboxylate transporter TctB family protein [Microvirga subterranea]RDI56793.1 putative tricarboxylic transport membrane protein [Microvirga subterranea]